MVMPMDLQNEAREQICANDLHIEDLTDIRTVRLPAGNSAEKLKAFLAAVKNPYLFRVGEVPVCVEFSKRSGDTLEGRLAHLLNNDI